MNCKLDIYYTPDDVVKFVEQLIIDSVCFGE